MSVATSITLLEKVKQPSDNEAWSRFYDLYSPVIFGFACQRGCNEATAEDVLQETMGRLWRYLPKFQYDSKRGKFSTYVCKIVLSVLDQHLKHQLPTLSLEEVVETDRVEISDPKSSQLFEEFEERWKKSILHHAYENIKKRVEHSTWLAYELLANRNKSGGEVANQLKEKRNTVFQRKDRVFKLLREEVRRLATETGDLNHAQALNEIEYDDELLQTQRNEKFFPPESVKKRFKILLKSYQSNPPSAAASPQLMVVTRGNSRWVHLTTPFSIGKNSENTLQLKSQFISKFHCKISNQQNRWSIADCDSTNGVLVNGKKVTEKKLSFGDVIQLGDTMLIFFVDVNKCKPQLSIT